MINRTRIIHESFSYASLDIEPPVLAAVADEPISTSSPGLAPLTLFATLQSTKPLIPKASQSVAHIKDDNVKSMAKVLDAYVEAMYPGYVDHAVKKAINRAKLASITPLSDDQI